MGTAGDGFVPSVEVFWGHWDELSHGCQLLSSPNPLPGKPPVHYFMRRYWFFTNEQLFKMSECVYIYNQRLLNLAKVGHKIKVRDCLACTHAAFLK